MPSIYPASMRFEFKVWTCQLPEGEFWRCRHIIKLDSGAVVGEGNEFTSRYKWWAIAFSMMDVAQGYILTRKG